MSVNMLIQDIINIQKNDLIFTYNYYILTSKQNSNISLIASNRIMYVPSTSRMLLRILNSCIN